MGRRILVVEDDTKTSASLELYLRHAGFEPQVARTGDEGLTRAQREQPDAVILDIREAIGAAHGIQVSAVALVPPGTIPKTTSGKLQRFACREGLMSGRMMPVSFWAAAS